MLMMPDTTPYFTSTVLDNRKNVITNVNLDRRNADVVIWITYFHPLLDD
jgi:hypothetical protein